VDPFSAEKIWIVHVYLILSGIYGCGVWIKPYIDAAIRDVPVMYRRIRKNAGMKWVDIFT
jgi:hypothetical protein